MADPVTSLAPSGGRGQPVHERRDERLGELAEAVQELGEQFDGIDPAKLPDSPLFVDAVVSATRTVEHTHQKDKLTTLRNAVLNSALPGPPTQTR
jgi:hypothetical protein